MLHEIEVEQPNIVYLEYFPYCSLNSRIKRRNDGEAFSPLNH